MSGLNEIEDLEKQLSNLSTFSESHKIAKHSMKWIISKSDIEKNIDNVGGYLQSNWIYKEDIKYYYLIFYPNGQDESSRGSASIKIVFYEEIPENASVEGEMSVKGTELNVTRKFNVKNFTKQQVIEFIETDYLRIHTAQNDLIIHCSIIHNIHYVECEFDGKKVHSKQVGKRDDFFRYVSKLSDITLNFNNDVKCAAVKAFLIKVPYFRKLLDEHDNVNYINMLDFDIKKPVFDEFLHYLYTDYLPLLDFKLACELYALAHCFEFSELKNVCFAYLSASLTTKNVLLVLKIAIKSNDIALKRECFQFIKESDADTLARESIW